MHQRPQDGFVEFARERTPELFRVAHALAGRQDAAEKLLQTALEKTLLRWRRLDDPYDFAVRAMTRRSLPWWRRWQRPGDAPPGSESGRVVDLTDLALAGARRRRLARVGSLAAVGVLLAATGVAVTLGAEDDPPSEPGQVADDDGTVDPTGRAVVVSYHHGGRHLLNPETGEYELSLNRAHEGSFSPDLRYSAVDAPDGMLIYSLVEGESREVTLPHRATGLHWSPDSSRMVMTIQSRPGVEFPDAVVIIEAGTGETTEVSLDFPDDLAAWHGHWLSSARWLDDEHLLVPTVDTSILLPDPMLTALYGVELDTELVTSVSVFDLTGALVDEFPISKYDLDAADEAHSSLMWMPTGLRRDDQFLLARTVESGAIQLATADLSTDDDPYEVAVEVEIPDDGNPERFVTARPIAWLPDGTVLLTTASLSTDLDEVMVAHLDTGEDLGRMPWPEVLDLLTDDPPVPSSATDLTIVDASHLGPEAAHLAF